MITIRKRDILSGEWVQECMLHPSVKFVFYGDPKGIR